MFQSTITLGLFFQGPWERRETLEMCFQFGVIAVTQVTLGCPAIKEKKDAKDTVVPQDIWVQKVQKVKETNMNELQ